MARSRFYKLRYKQVPGIVLVTALLSLRFDPRSYPAAMLVAG